MHLLMEDHEGALQLVLEPDLNVASEKSPTPALAQSAPLELLT